MKTFIKSIFLIIVCSFMIYNLFGQSISSNQAENRVDVGIAFLIVAGMSYGAIKLIRNQDIAV